MLATLATAATSRSKVASGCGNRIQSARSTTNDEHAEHADVQARNRDEMARTGSAKVGPMLLA